MASLEGPADVGTEGTHETVQHQEELSPAAATDGSEERARNRCPRPNLEIDTAEEEGEVEPLPSYIDNKRIAFDMTPHSCRSTDSTKEYHKPEQTIIIFDWDDTLCPSTTCMRQHGLSVLGEPPEGNVAQALEDLSLEARALLEQAAELAEKVIVVTNAEEGWVDLSCRAWLPQLQQTLTLCEVASARSTWEPRGIVSPAGWKARTFEDAIDKFYSRYQHQSWKNVISIGDGPHEREALSRVVKKAPCCRSKSVKFVLRPSIEQLIREIQLLRENLREIVVHDDDLDLHFSAEVLDETLVQDVPV